MRKTAMAACLLLLFTLLAPGAGAARVEDIGVAQAFAGGGALYTYLYTADVVEDQTAFMVTARIGDSAGAFPANQPIQTVEEAKVPVYYMFLIDSSKPMAAYSNQIKTFVSRFVENSGGARYLLATLGETFSPMEGGFTASPQVIKNQLEDLGFDANETRLYSGIGEAINYFHERAREGRELYNLIVISDGVEEEAAIPQEVLDELIYPEVTIHTLGFLNPGPVESGGAGSEASAKLMLSTMGYLAKRTSGVACIYDADSQDENVTAIDISKHVSGLYAATFDISGLQSAGQDYTVQINLYQDTRQLNSGKEVSCLVHIPKPAASPGQENPNPGQVNPSPGQEDPSPGQENPSPGQETPPDGTGQDGETVTGEPGTTPSPTPPETDYTLIAIIAGAAVVVILAVCILFVLLGRKKKAAASQDVPPLPPIAHDTPDVPPGPSVYMKLDVISGQLQGTQNEFYMRNQLLIGRDPGCDIVFLDLDVSGRNTRVFVSDSVIYLEDLNSPNGTAISEMRIHAPNRLRSGDMISIGTVRFTLKF